MLECSHKYDLVMKKNRMSKFSRMPKTTFAFFYLMIVLVRAALSAKLVLRYKHKFEAIL